MVGLFLFNLLGLGVLMAFIPFEKVKEVLGSGLGSSSWTDETRLGLLLCQGIISLGSFILVPLFILTRYDGISINGLNSIKIPRNSLWLATGILVIISMPANAWVIEWNKGWDFPSWMESFETWSANKEAELQKLTMFLTQFSNPLEFGLGMIVIAIIPGIGEELLFRGILQNRIRQITGNVHAAVWISAFIFSLIHLQLYGLVPRMLLGAMFGYVYAISGSLWLAMFGHFVNNGLTLLILYLSSQGLTNIDLEKTDSVPWPFSILSALATMVLIFWIGRKSDVKSGETIWETAING